MERRGRVEGKTACMIRAPDQRGDTIEKVIL